MTVYIILQFWHKVSRSLFKHTPASRQRLLYIVYFYANPKMYATANGAPNLAVALFLLKSGLPASRKQLPFVLTQLRRRVSFVKTNANYVCVGRGKKSHSFRTLIHMRGNVR